MLVLVLMLMLMRLRVPLSVPVPGRALVPETVLVWVRVAFCGSWRRPCAVGRAGELRPR